MLVFSSITKVWFIYTCIMQINPEVYHYLPRLITDFSWHKRNTGTLILSEQKSLLIPYVWHRGEISCKLITLCTFSFLPLLCGPFCSIWGDWIGLWWGWGNFCGLTSWLLGGGWLHLLTGRGRLWGRGWCCVAGLLLHLLILLLLVH